jgi:glutamine---fructose-6-phosphate transaminase (isomerizing)
MCGIFGLGVNKEDLKYKDLLNDIKLLYKISEDRGKDSSGISILSNDKILTYRKIMRPCHMINETKFLETVNQAFEGCSEQVKLIGHCRLTTDGSFASHENNHPIDSNSFVGVHNGIVLNAIDLVGKQTNHLISREHLSAQSDTKLFFQKIEEINERTNSLTQAISEVYFLIDGAASIALLDKNGNIVIGSNTGSLYYIEDEIGGNFLFASEASFIRRFLLKSRIFEKGAFYITQVKPNTGLAMSSTLKKFIFEQEKEKAEVLLETEKFFPNIEIRSSVSDLKRCKKCILPETYPFISFDSKGVCNFCSSHEKQTFHGREKLEEFLNPYRSKDGSPDCLVGLSGGRDSCYGLHVLKNEFEMNPIAYTYDWGLTTDTSRRNQAKVTGKLGIEHILRAADTQRKRQNLRHNIMAWLKRPHLGMVPLFMAGDKDFYQYGRTLKKDFNLELTIFCSGYLLEQREFFVGFCGVNQNVTSTARAYDYAFLAKYQLATFYIGQYLKNPFYINRSFFDSIRSFFTTFMLKDDFLYLYEYLPWEEKRIEETLKREFDWEVDSAYGKNQWRMGDGQTAFTNYIYYSLAGFSEFDNFRSNQIREGLLTRDDALRLVKEDNRPKIDTLQYFAYLIGFNLDVVLSKIDAIPKMY